MNVLSLFDGISACHLALTRSGIEVDTYYTAEIDKYATQISEHHYPDAIRFGDVTKWEEWDIDWSSIDIVTGGFPCQAWSVAGKQLGDKDERGMLFWTMLDIMKKVLKHNPKAYFLMENVKMKKEFEEYITHHTDQALGHVEKHLINSALLSAQNRNRYYWTNIQGITQPEDKGLILADIIEDGKAIAEKGQTILATIYKENAKSMVKRNKKGLLVERPIRTADIGKGGQGNRVYSVDGKGITLSAQSGGKAGNGNMLIERPCEPKVLVGRMVGRKINPVTNKRDDYNPDLKTEQRIEPRLDEKCGTLTTVSKDNILIVPEATKKGYAEIEPGQCVDLTFPNSKTRRGRKMESKSNCLTAASFDYNHWNGHTYRKLTPLECERLQTFPYNWTLVTDESGKQLVSNTQRYKALGNAWTVDVIAHIFSFIEKQPGLVTLEGGLFIPKGTQLALEFYDELNKVAVE